MHQVIRVTFMEAAWLGRVCTLTATAHASAPLCFRALCVGGAWQGALGRRRARSEASGNDSLSWYYMLLMLRGRAYMHFLSSGRHSQVSSM